MLLATGASSTATTTTELGTASFSFIQIKLNFYAVFQQFEILLISETFPIWNCNKLSMLVLVLKQIFCLTTLLWAAQRSQKQQQDRSLRSGLMLKSAVESATSEQLKESAMPKFYDLQLQDSWPLKTHGIHKISCCINTCESTFALRQQILESGLVMPNDGTNSQGLSQRSHSPNYKMYEAALSKK